MKVSTKYGYGMRRDSVTSLETAGVLGETYLDIDSSQAVGATGAGWRHAAHTGASRLQPGGARQPEHAAEHGRAAEARRPHPGLRRKRQGIAGKADLRSDAVQPLLGRPLRISRKSWSRSAMARAAWAALISRNDAYDKFIATLDKMNGVIDDMQQGKGTAGKFLKDPSLYNNANDTIANLKKSHRRHQCGQGHARQADQGRGTGQETRHHDHQTLAS